MLAKSITKFCRKHGIKIDMQGPDVQFIMPTGYVFSTEASSRLIEDYADMLDRINAPDLPVDGNSVLVLKNAGPKGVPGFPEWGMIPVPRKLLEQGVTDVVRVSDSRMSGTSFGTVVLHVAPEAAAGGALALVEEGDTIVISDTSRFQDAKSILLRN